MKTLFTSLLALLLLSLSVVAQNQYLGSSDRTIIRSWSSEPDGLHPINNTSGNRTELFNYTQKTLTKLDLASYQTIPILLEQLPSISEDGLHYHFKLRRDVRWDNGEAFTAKDVLFTVKLMLCPFVENMAIQGNYSIVIEDITFNPDAPYSFTMKSNGLQTAAQDIFSEIYMMQQSHWDPESYFDKYTLPELNLPIEQFNGKNSLQQFVNGINDSINAFDPNRLVGLGPYQVTRWETDSIIELTRKENWWGDGDTSMYNANRPYKIIYIQTDREKIKASLLNGKIDVTSLSVTATLKAMEDDTINSQYNFKFLDEYAYAYIGLNIKPDSSRVKLFTDARLRRALAHATPTQSIIDSVYYGKAMRAVSNISPLKEEFNDQLKPISYDLKLASTILDSLGWVDLNKDGILEKDIDGQKIEFEFELNYFGTSTVSKRMATMIQESYAKVGVKVKTIPLDFTILYKNAYNHDFDAMFGVWGGSGAFSDPRQLWHTESWTMHGSNFFGFGNDDSDALIEKINTTIDIDERNELSKKLQQKIYDEQVYIFLYQRLSVIAYKKDLKNAKLYNAKPNILLNTLH